MFTGYCYKVQSEVKRSWNASNALCQAEGGELASIKSRKESQFVKGKKYKIINIIVL